MKPGNLLVVLISLGMMLCVLFPQGQYAHTGAFTADSSTLKNPLKIKVLAAKSVADFVPPGYAILFQTSCNLNLDSITDKIILLHKMGDDTFTYEPSMDKRILLLLYGQADQSFKLALQHSKLIYYYGYDLNFKEAFVDISCKPGQFTISHYGGFAERWGRSTTFNYNAADAKWYLIEDAYTTFQAIDEAHTLKEEIRTPKEFGKVLIDSFDIYKTGKY